MANTPKGIPYPIGTDRVMDGDNAMQAIAEKVDALLPVTVRGSLTTDASGYATVPHGQATTPTAAIFQLDRTSGNLYGHWWTDTYTATTVRVRVGDPSGGVAATQVIPYRVTYTFT